MAELHKSVGAALSGAPVPRLYRTLFVLGRGGMGSVEAALAVEPVEAEGTPSYERVVALKRLLPEARDPRRTEMFLREARLAAMLDHPNVVRAFDYGELDGELYLAMEYVEGQPLSRVLRALAEANERLPVDLAAHILAEVCRGLHAAHELADARTGQALNLVHRDVSPQNVMIGYDGHVRLLDFGVAKIATESLTKTGEVKGKTPYMSPEQAMGDPIDRRSDLFGVGAMLFECITLKRMWGDGTDMDVIRKLALEEPPPLEAPEAMTSLYTRLVARKAEGRPATAAEAARELDAFVRERGYAEDATRDLRVVLGRHFDAEAKAQQKKLTSALHDVAPARAEELRASVLPELPRAAPASALPTPTRTGRTALLALIGLVVLIGAWRLATPRDRPVITPSPPATTLEPRVEPPAPTLGIPDVPRASAHLSPSARGNGAPPPAPRAVEPQPTPTPRPPPTRVVVPARPTVSAAPSHAPSHVAAPPKPPDVDEHPF